MVESYKSSALSLAPIHRSAWKGNSQNFALTEFSEVSIARPLKSLNREFVGG
jgi:hypothetical protein